jgi:hypothetical protein
MTKARLRCLSLQTVGRQRRIENLSLGVRIPSSEDGLLGLGAKILAGRWKL